jgi:hypothetical protein
MNMSRLLVLRWVRALALAMLVGCTGTDPLPGDAAVDSDVPIDSPEPDARYQEDGPSDRLETEPDTRYQGDGPSDRLSLQGSEIRKRTASQGVVSEQHASTSSGAARRWSMSGAELMHGSHGAG